MLDEQAITLAAKLYKIRATGWWLLGGKYESETADYRQLVKGLAHHSHGGDLLVAYKHLMGELNEAGIYCAGTELRLTCALVDLLDGSNP